MKKLTKLLALSMTAGMLLAACGDANNDMEDPAVEEPAVEDPTVEEGMEDGMDEDLDGGTDDGIEGDTDTEG